MFETNVGPFVNDSSRAYLRPETAQQIYINFKNVLIQLQDPYHLELHK